MEKRNKGQVLVLVALCLFVLLGFAALGIDVGYMYSVRHELQRSADAGALAGASAFRETGRDSTDGTTRTLAEDRARDYATRDIVIRSPLDNSEVSVSFPTDNNLMRIRVDVNRPASLFFARILGRDNAAISAYAVAEAFPVSSNLECVVPWGIPAPWTNNDNNNSYDQGDTVNWPLGETYNETHCINKAITPWNIDNHVAGTPVSDVDQYLCNGSLQTLKIGDTQSSSISGNFYGIDFSQFVIPSDSCPADNVNSGANFYQFMIENPCACDLNIDLTANLPSVPTEPGMMVGPTLKATAPDSYFFNPGGIPGKADTNSLMNQDPSGFWDPQTNTPNSLDPRYSANNWSKSPRVVRIPVYHPDANFNEGLNTPSGGSNPFQPLGFFGFWVQDIVYIDKDPVTGKQLGTVVGRFVTVEGVGSGEEDAEGTILNIRLVE
jgi:hypothetical protein